MNFGLRIANFSCRAVSNTMAEPSHDAKPTISKSAIRNSQSDPSRYDQKLELILRTSARIFAAKSYHSTSMRDISRATGVSLACRYHSCTSKEELLFLIQYRCL